MSAREKDHRAIQDILKHLFKKKNPGISKGKPEFTLTASMLKDLGKESPVTVRTRTLQELTEIIVDNKVEQKSIGNLWYLIKDLLSADHLKETRVAVFSFLQCLILTQYDRLVNIMRGEFFRFIKMHNIVEDIPERFELLQVLTNKGKDLQYFEEEVGPFLLNWAPEIEQSEKDEEYLQLVVNVIKFNAAYLDDLTIIGFIHNISTVMCTSKNTRKVTGCLNILSAFVAYSNMPRASLPEFVASLCRTVNTREYCPSSWNVMKNLLGTHMGHSSIYLMCQILRDERLKDDEMLLRGCIFFIHTALWSNQPVTNLVCPPLSVLPSINEALSYERAGITYEVTVAVDRLVAKFSKDLTGSVWEVVITILENIVRQIEGKPDSLIMKKLVPPLQDMLNIIENLVESDFYNGRPERFYSLLEGCISIRNDESTFKLIDYLSSNIAPYEDEWLNLLCNFLQKYFKPEIKSNIRLRVLKNISTIFHRNMTQYGEELVDVVVVPFMSNLHNDPEVLFRADAVNLLIDLSMICESKRCLEIFDILEKVLYQPFDSSNVTGQVKRTETDFYDIKCLVTGLINVFSDKLYKTPPSHPLKIYEMLTHFLKLNYDFPKVFEQYSEPRFLIFSYFLKMRANDKYCLGCPNKDGVIKYSSYVYIIYQESDIGPLGSPLPANSSTGQAATPFVEPYLPLRKVFRIFRTAMNSEKDWKVLNAILQELPKVLQNKSLILSKTGNKELHYFIDSIFDMLSDSTHLESLNTRVTKTDFHATALYLLLNMASYYNHIPANSQHNMISSLMQVLPMLHRSVIRNCISTLTICALEMRDAMLRIFPKLLLTLSKISATVQIALPMLEFLSVVSQLPCVYINFTSTQYMAVFAISLPYTNPFKFHNYIASLAHQVISVWFLKCRISLRKNFVKYITTGLQTNVIIPFEEEKAFLRSEVQRLGEMNQDSTDRKRSSSLTEQGHPRRRAATVSSRVESKPKPYLQKPLTNNTAFTFYKELTEICVDLMARYAFMRSQGTMRGSLNDFLLRRGHRMTWLVGHTIITITTSGCSGKILRNGICDGCWKVITASSGDSANLSRQNSSDGEPTSSPVDETAPPLKDAEDQGGYKCPCWCTGWAEIHFRRPTGDMIFLIRVTPEDCDIDIPLKELTDLYVPFIINPDPVDKESEAPAAAVTTEEASVPSGSPRIRNSPSRQSSRESVDDESDTVFDDGTTARNPVRRSNSSPEMSASWKNPFLRQKQQEIEEDSSAQDDDTMKKNKMYAKDMRVSCEAIPEEIGGLATTPPKADLPNQDPPQPTVSSTQSAQSAQSTQSTLHPSLLSYHSYPGSSPPNEAAAALKPCQTVPASPNTAQSTRVQLTFPKVHVKAPQDDKGADRPSSLVGLAYLPPLSSKPPQSPTQTSPRLPRHMLIRDREGHEIQKSSSSSVIEKTTSGLTLARDRARERRSIENFERSMSVQDSSHKRDRLHTVSVMSSSTTKQENQQRTGAETPRNLITPSMVFLHMYHSAIYGFKGERPLLVTDGDNGVLRSLRILDSIPTYQTYTIGVIYIGDGQCNNEVDILRNTYGSMRFTYFLGTLGKIIKLQDANPQKTFLGGLERNGNDGKYTYVWDDDFIRVMFHVATLMPTRESDPKCTNKKRHIGNDSVVIVYNESGKEYDINTLKGQMNFASIIVEPFDHDTNRVSVKAKPDLFELIGEVAPVIVTEQSVAILTRQLALHYDLASHVLKSSKTSAKDPYSSNWLERLRKIKHIREKLIEEKEKERQKKHGMEDPTYVGRLNNIDDGTDYT